MWILHFRLTAFAALLLVQSTQAFLQNGPPAVKNVRGGVGKRVFRGCEGNANGATVELTSVPVRL